MSNKKKSIKKSINRVTKKFPWKPTPAIEWILKTDRTKFTETHAYAPLSILLEEYGYLQQAYGQLYTTIKHDDFWNDERAKELRFRTDYIEEKIKAKYYGMVETIDRMDYHDMLETKESKKS